jgi:NADPH:quinone reductase-like Zn-dependent oxidoreductase
MEVEMETMKAVRIHRFGGPEVMAWEDVPIPQPMDDEILVRVRAASVNPVDYKIREGKYPLVKEKQLPVILGRDLCGEVVACGTASLSIKHGDPIYAFLGPDRGAYAEYAVVRAVEYTAKPKKADDIAAGAIPLAALTAWQGLFDHGALTAGERVLIHGGAGGVGHFAVQFAKAKGAEVWTTVSTADVDFAHELGADQVIDYKTQRFEDMACDVDLVFDLIAGQTQERSWKVLKRKGGRLVSTLTEPSHEQALTHDARALHYMAQPDGAQLARIGELIDAGRVRPVVSRIFKLSDAAAAQTYLQREHVRGKVVLRPDSR